MLETSSETSNRNLSVLLVEDSVLLAERLSELVCGIAGLDLAGVVDSEAAAIEFVGDRTIDVMLLDLHLRHGTGFGVLRALSKNHPADVHRDVQKEVSGEVSSDNTQHERARRPIIVVLTNYDLAEYRRAATALGAEYFLDKARDMEQLPSVLDRIRAGMN